jgi:hypothetical protein
VIHKTKKKTKVIKIQDLQKQIREYIDNWFDSAVNLGFIVHRGKQYEILPINDKRCMKK